MNRVVLLGAGSHARVVLDILRSAEAPVDVIGLVDASDAPDPSERTVAGLPVFGDLPEEVPAAVPAVGDGRRRQQLIDRARRAGLRIVGAVHPSAVVSGAARLGEGVVICPGAVIVTGAVLGEGVIVNTGATVDHDCSLGSCCHIAPGAHLAGCVTVGDRAWIGIGAVVRQGITIGADATVGAGAAVVADVSPGVTVVGVPARPIRPTDG